MHNNNDITELLEAVSLGNSEAANQLVGAVYGELRTLAQRAMRSERSNHTLQATALVNEALLRLLGSEVDYQNRLHFFRIAANTMRRVLVDYARAVNSDKRGDKQFQLTFDESLYSGGEIKTEQLIAMDDALTQLKAMDERKVHILELHFFAGVPVDEIATILNISRATIMRDLKFSKAWIKDEIGLL